MLLRKMLRDLKNNVAQFLAIFLMIFLGVFIFSGMTSIGQGMKQSSQDYYDETDLADAIVYSSFFTNQDYEQLKNISGIETITKRLQLDTAYESDSATTLQLNVINSDVLSAEADAAIAVRGQGFFGGFIVTQLIGDLVDTRPHIGSFGGDLHRVVIQYVR